MHRSETLFYRILAVGVFFFLYCSHVQWSNQCWEVCGGGGEREEKTISSGFKLFTNAYCTDKNSFSVRINYKHSLQLWTLLHCFIAWTNNHCCFHKLHYIISLCVLRTNARRPSETHVFYGMCLCVCIVSVYTYIELIMCSNKTWWWRRWWRRRSKWIREIQMWLSVFASLRFPLQSAPV